jgi:hypothetical protein
MWYKFKNSKLGSTALTIGATSLASFVAFGPAKAAPTTDCTPITTAGGSSISSPTVIDPSCSFTSIEVNQDVPAYWEFSWDQVPFDPVNISATGSFGGTTGSFFGGDPGSLALYNAADDSLVTAANFTADPSDPFDSTSLGDLVLAPQDYIIGILPAPGEAEGVFATITFAAATDVPEPATLGLFAGVLTALGLIRKRRESPAR